MTLILLILTPKVETKRDASRACPSTTSVDGSPEVLAKLAALLHRSPEVLAKLAALLQNLKSPKDLTASTFCNVEKIRETTNETGTHVARLRIKLDKVIKEDVKHFGDFPTKMSNKFEEIYGVVGTKFDAMKEAVVNTLVYFLTLQ
ncbi:hypothetical protein FXO37_15432 [Capsicum annuum]|nr:hypothetical protein FXO37_15432 [Capsicum annuum]